jgi:glycerol uptake facilitator-like aquaporin
MGLLFSVEMMGCGPLTGAATLRARWLGPALAAGAWDNWFVWIVGPVAGGIVAAVLYSMVFLKDQQPATP